MDATTTMPPEIAKAIIEIMSKAKQLGFDEKNLHGGYSYASIDKFLASMRPLCAEAGLAILLDEAGHEFRESGKGTNYAFLDYEVWLVHSSGAMHGPLRRHLALPATGPQSFGAAESYVLKRFMRNLFQIPTGEKDGDADALPAGNIPTRPSAEKRIEKEWAEPPHDPSTGEIKPVLVLGKTPHEWGGKFIAGVKTSTTQAEVDLWCQLNAAVIEKAKTSGASVHQKVEAAIAATRSRIGPEQLVGEEDTGNVLQV